MKPHEGINTVMFYKVGIKHIKDKDRIVLIKEIHKTKEINLLLLSSES